MRAGEDGTLRDICRRSLSLRCRRAAFHMEASIEASRSTSLPSITYCGPKVRRYNDQS